MTESTTTEPAAPPPPAHSSEADEREERLRRGADDLSGRRFGGLVERQQFLLVLAAALMTLGLTAIVLGWAGAARSTLVEEQLPYLISGGLLGLALATIGALTFFTHWLTVSIREARSHEAVRRQQHAELMDALRELSESMVPLHATSGKEGGNGHARGARARRPLRGAPGGS